MPLSTLFSWSARAGLLASVVCGCGLLGLSAALLRKCRIVSDGPGLRRALPVRQLCSLLGTRGTRGGQQARCLRLPAAVDITGWLDAAAALMACTAASFHPPLSFDRFASKRSQTVLGHLTGFMMRFGSYWVSASTVLKTVEERTGGAILAKGELASCHTAMRQ